jgi:gluconolactonase
MKKIILFGISLIFIGCNSSKKNSNPKIKIYDESVLSIIDQDSNIEQLADSISLPEGPVWDKSSNSLLFVDVINNKVLKWNEDQGVTDFISPSGNTGYAPNIGKGLLGANGLSIDSDGNIILCQHGDRRLASIENNSTDNPTFKTLVDNFQGKTLNSPNDLTIDKDGSIYFTDPAFGFFDLNTFQFIDSDLRQLEKNGVYKYDRIENEIYLVSDNIDLPNGIALSPDEMFLYVNKMGTLDQNPQIIKIDLQNMSSKVFFDGKELSKNNEGSFDGMKVHSSGHIFTSGPGGLLVISPEGKHLATIDFGHITNCAFDTDEKYLYVTGFVNNPKVFRIKLK